MYSLTKSLLNCIFLIIFVPQSLMGQPYVVENFSLPICANGNGQTTLNFYEEYNGEHSCNYRVVFANVFTSW